MKQTRSQEILLLFSVVMLLTLLHVPNQISMLAFPSANPSGPAEPPQEETIEPQSRSPAIQENDNRTGNALGQLGEEIQRLFGGSPNQLPPDNPAQQQQQRPTLGINGFDMAPQLAERMNLTQSQKGFLIEDVISGGPADIAGIRGGYKVANIDGSILDLGGDIVVGIDSVNINTIQDILSYLDTKSVGDEVQIQLIRDGQEFTIPLILGHLQSDQTPFEQQVVPECGTVVTGIVNLTENLNCTGDGLIIGDDDTVINMNGYSIQGPDQENNKTGVIIPTNHNVLIKGPGLIDGFTFGIIITDSVNSQISDLTIESNHVGICLDNSVLQIVGNTIRNNGVGVLIHNVKNPNISEDQIAGNNHLADNTMNVKSISVTPPNATLAMICLS